MEDQKSRLSRVYSQHHESGKRYGYLFCHGDRGPYLKEWIGVGKKVLDLGCRDGMLTQSFNSGNTVIGADIDKQALQRIQERLGIETNWLDLNTEWPYDPESFDVIVSCEILEHLFFPFIFLENVLKSLKKGGLFIGSVPNAFRMRNRWKFLFGCEFDADSTHVRFFSYSKLFDLLSCSFDSVEIIPIRGKVAPFISVKPSLPPLLTRLFAKDLLWRAQK